MLKHLFASLVTTAMVFASLPFVPAKATSEPIVIDNILSLCQAIIAGGYGFNDSKSCDAYSSTQTSATITGYVEVTSDLVLKDLNLTFYRSATPFIIHSGSVTIEGGYYSSPSCVVWVQYNNRFAPGYYVPSTSVTINSGTFEATVTTENSAESPSPVCLITYYTVTPEEAKKIIADYLPVGKRFVDMAPVTRTTRSATTSGTTDIEAESGYAHIQKAPEERDEVKYLKTTRVAVVGTPAPAPEQPETEPEPEPQVTPETPSPEPETKTLPKAPRTGVK